MAAKLKEVFMDKSDPPAVAPVRLENPAVLRRQRAALVKAVKEARAALDEAKQRTDDEVAALASGASAARGGRTAVGVLYEEVTQAEATLRANESALAMIDRKLADFATPERQAAAAAQKAAWCAYTGEMAQVIDEIERLVRVDLIAKLKRLHELDDRRATALNAGFNFASSADGLRRSFAQALAPALNPYVNGQEYGWCSGGSSSPMGEGWARQMLARSGSAEDEIAALV